MIKHCRADQLIHRFFFFGHSLGMNPLLGELLLKSSKGSWKIPLLRPAKLDTMAQALSPICFGCWPQCVCTRTSPSCSTGSRHCSLTAFVVGRWKAWHFDARLPRKHWSTLRREIAMGFTSKLPVATHFTKLYDIAHTSSLMLWRLSELSRAFKHQVWLF